MDHFIGAWKSEKVEGRNFENYRPLPVQFSNSFLDDQKRLVNLAFPGKKTILGDASQAVNPFSSTTDDIKKVFPQADVVKLNKSYRSTWEIAYFALGIKSNPDLEAVERHGPTPEVLGFLNPHDEITVIRKRLEVFRSSAFMMMAVLCKTPAQAKSMHEKLKEPDVFLLTEESTHFREGVVITSIPLAKGLEFDEVLVPFVSDEHYHTQSDRSLLYMACTRAMHHLTITFTGKRSPF